MLTAIGQAAKKAELQLRKMDTGTKNRVLTAMAQSILDHETDILVANEQDMRQASLNGMNSTMLDRLKLTSERIKGMAKGITDIVQLPDPCGRVLSGTLNPNGFRVEKISVPLGVIAVIYEARPNVTADAAALCIKAGNAVILRGGKEAILSNLSVCQAMREAIRNLGLDENFVQLVTDTSRESAAALMRLNGYVDVLIPRGGAGLIRACVENATVPVIETGTGNCHIYVDKDADLDKAVAIIENAKLSRPSVCNACESLLIHRDVLKQALPKIEQALQKKEVVFHACPESLPLLKNAVAATEQDYGKEYLGYEISVKAVSGLDEALTYIEHYSTGHSECIVTENYQAAERFLNEVDSAAVYVNVSTRFTDGGEFGFGAEIGISTQKLHARGPLGLPELNTCKYVIRGNGQVR